MAKSPSRKEQPKPMKSGDISWVSILLFANILSFLLINLPGNTALQNWLSFNCRDLMTGLQGDLCALLHALITMVTYLFIHSGRNHLVTNMAMLLLFGPIVEEQLGRKSFMTIYLVSGLVGVLLFFSFYPDAMTYARGASASVCGVMASVPALTYLKRLRFSIWTWASILLVAFLFTDELLSINDSATSGIAHAAHVGGFIAGALSTIMLHRAKTKISKNHS